MTIIEQVGKEHVLPLLQVQVNSAQVTVKQAHPDLVQDSQVHDSHMSELPEQAHVSYLEVGRIQAEEGTEVHVEKMHIERVNQMPGEMPTELLEVDLDHVTPEIMSQEESLPKQVLLRLSGKITKVLRV
ncbi:Zinc finger protein 131 [Sciurus carolinensis]|uniref:Zinc finger protein 131 n=1 Tax=Sciurus carolinensis TaxID=30640 RepID=A0AA41T802_SCICA|nr:Zinc finger protein 131 [Sciurus carolinensis]